MEPKRITPDATALRALAHPVRMRILGILRLDGPSTATALAARLGLNSGATSYHLRQLALHGFVEDDPDNGAGTGNGRDRWWRAAHTSTEYVEPVDAAPEEREASDAFGQSIAIVHRDLTQAAVEERSSLAPEWRNVSTLSDWVVRATPERARELAESLHAVVAAFESDDEDTEGAERLFLIVDTFPLPRRLLDGPEPGEPS